MSDTSCDDLVVIRERALNLLARREHGCVELNRKLEQKGFEKASVKQVLAELEQEGLLSDRRYTEALVHSRIGRGQGPLKIRAELSQKAIDDALVEEVMSNLDVDWHEVAEDAWRKRFKSKMPEDYQEKSKQARFLSSRGFSSNAIWRVLGEIE